MRPFLFTYLILIFGSATIAFAQKTDTVTLYNGDRITCEIKSLSKGKLTVKTSDMSTLNIKWVRIASLESLHQFEVATTDHSVYFGTFAKDTAGSTTLRFGVFEEQFLLTEITSITQINSKFWQQLNGSFDAGYSYTRGNQNLQFNGSGEIERRTKKNLNKLEFSSVISDNSQNLSKKQNGSYALQIFHKKSFFSLYNLTWEQNTELGVENRGAINARFGFSPIDSKANLLDISMGILLNREFSSEQTATNNTEGILSASYDLFMFTKPNIDLSTSIILYPSFTVKNRYRSEFNFRVRWEVFNNFTLNFKYYFTQDNKPPSADALKFDYGINTSIGYTF